jgi:hypothetical protein
MQLCKPYSEQVIDLYIQVIQKVVERISAERLAFVDAFRGNVYDLASHPYGCRVLQRCLEHLPITRTRPLLDELHERTLELMQDQFGVSCDTNFHGIIWPHVS